MATRVVTTLIDDLDGGPADETVTFAIDGRGPPEVDLSRKNAKALRSAMERYISAGRRTGGRTTRRRRPTSTGDIDVPAVKAWADANGLAYSSRGRLSGALVEQYRQATA